MSLRCLLVEPQHQFFAMFLISEYINIPLDAIGNIFGKDHSTVIYAKNKIIEDMKTSKKLEVSINDMKHMIEGK